VTIGSRYRRVMPFVLAVYILVVVALFLYLNLRLTVEWVATILFVAALLSGRGLLFLRDWGVFIVVLLAWQLTSFLAIYFPFPWHLTELIDADKFVFAGHVPTVWLQKHLYHRGILEPWDVLAASMYMLHFLAPLVAGFLLWIADRGMFRRFATTFVLVAMAGFVTYILYPAVPPWMAGESLARVHGTYQVAARGAGHVYLPGVKNLFDVLAGHWYNPNHGNISLHFLRIPYDSVAAMPSEHAAFPMLFFLFLRRQFGRPAYLALIYMAAILFSITYLGQHYVIDAVVGFAYAIAGYMLVMHLTPAISRRITLQLPSTGGRPAMALPELTDLEEA
jgi:membrane-associated phospholipid phosphatase